MKAALNFFVVFFCFVGATTTFSRDTTSYFLVLRDNSYIADHFIKEGTTVKVWTGDTEIVGRMKIVDEHTILLDSTEIVLDQVKKIRANSRIRKMAFPIIAFTPLAVGGIFAGAIAITGNGNSGEAFTLGIFGTLCTTLIAIPTTGNRRFVINESTKITVEKLPEKE